jgi:ribokinase
MNQVVVVGSVNIDLVADVAHLPTPGETVLGGRLRRSPGGKGANQAVAAHRLGARTVLVGAVGDDTFADDALTALAHEGLDTGAVRRVAGVPTGVALIVVATEGENTIVVTPGANWALTAADVATLRTLELAPRAVLALQMEVPLAACLEAASIARSRGATVLLNCAPMPDRPQLVLTDLLAMTDVLVVNESEALALVPGDEPVDPQGWLALANRLRDLGPAACVVTLGHQGAVVVADDVAHVQPAFRVQTVDTTGAGDTFCAALAVSLAEGESLSAAVARACAAGALATTGPGAYPAAPVASAVDSLLARQEVG